MTVSGIVSRPTHETALTAGNDARIGNIFSSAGNGNAGNGTNSFASRLGKTTCAVLEDNSPRPR
jgi:hypothetical protein